MAYAKPPADVVDVLGGASILARELSRTSGRHIERFAVQMWKRRGVPKSWTLAVERLLYARIDRAFDRKAA